jgi:Ca-activated chloride channel family protein
MNSFTLSPSLGWPVGITLAILMVILAIAIIAVHIHRRSNSDETLTACVRRSLICLLVGAMALTPSVIISTTSKAVNATDVVMAVDVTGSMAVNDAQYGSNDTITRLQAAQDAVNDITASYENSSFAALRFGVSGTLDVPLTPDALAIRNWAKTLSVESTSVSTGSSLDAPLNQLLLTLKSIREQHPDDAIVLYIITDGEQTAVKTRRTYSSLRNYLDDAFTVGVGSTQGGQIPVTAEQGTTQSDGQWVIDPSTGQPGVSKMDEANLKTIADELSGTSIVLNAQQTMKNGVSSQKSKQWRVTQSARARQRLEPVVWPLAIVTALLLMWELGAWIASTRSML